VYEAPWAFSFWDSSIHVQTLLDGMIGRGEIPPEIVVFIAHNGGPYPDSECVDSTDGREWFDRYVSGTVVPYVDATYRTIATPAARTILGFSMGGFCAPVLALHHPDLFGQVVAFSGYYVAGIRSGQTVNAALPFGGSTSAIVANSPIDMAATLPPSVRRGLLFVIVGTPGEPFYGQQFLSFTAELSKDGYPVSVIASPIAHSWTQVRAAFPGALRIVAGRQVAEGVFSS
jgi:S-formylglutathione hydrolase FrmB